MTLGKHSIPQRRAIDAAQFRRQAVQAEASGAEYVAFAIKIGCTVRGDEITVHTPEQEHALNEKWNQLTGKSSGA